MRVFRGVCILAGGALLLWPRRRSGCSCVRLVRSGTFRSTLWPCRRSTDLIWNMRSFSIFEFDQLPSKGRCCRCSFLVVGDLLLIQKDRHRLCILELHCSGSWHSSSTRAQGRKLLSILRLFAPSQVDGKLSESWGRATCDGVFLCHAKNRVHVIWWNVATSLCIFHASRHYPRITQIIPSRDRRKCLIYDPILACRPRLRSQLH
jgi:hypothetical protein